MTPKQRITKDMVMSAAFELLREGGESQVLVKNIAMKLSCSVQPIYSYCENMDALRIELSGMAGQALNKYVSERVDMSDPFASTGRAFVDFAQAEPHVFKSYILRERSGIHSFADIYEAEASPQIAEFLMSKHGISREEACELHMNMIIYSAGISFLLISSGGNLPQQELYDKLENAYHAFTKKS